MDALKEELGRLNAKLDEKEACKLKLMAENRLNEARVLDDDIDKLVQQRGHLWGLLGKTRELSVLYVRCAGHLQRFVALCIVCIIDDLTGVFWLRGPALT